MPELKRREIIYDSVGIRLIFSAEVLFFCFGRMGMHSVTNQDRITIRWLMMSLKGNQPLRDVVALIHFGAIIITANKSKGLSSYSGGEMVGIKII